MKLYKNNNQEQKILALTLYCDLGLKLKDTKYFARLRDFIELEVALCQEGDLDYLLKMLAIIKKLSQN